MFFREIHEVKNPETLKKERLIGELATIFICEETRERREKLLNEIRRLETLEQSRAMAQTAWDQTLAFDPTKPMF